MYRPKVLWMAQDLAASFWMKNSKLSLENSEVITVQYLGYSGLPSLDLGVSLFSNHPHISKAYLYTNTAFIPGLA